MQKKTLQNLIVIALALGPIVYLIYVWKNFPNVIATHYDINFKPNAFGNKAFLWIPSLLLAAISIGIYFLLKNIHSIDPKRYGIEKKDSLMRLGIIIICFMSILSFIILLAITKNIKILDRFLLPVIGLMIACIGNYMANLKQNYFFGIRLPWTLNSEFNWRKTHQFASKIWFFGGLIIAIFTSILPPPINVIIMLVMAVFMAAISIWYSYSIFKKEKLPV